MNETGSSHSQLTQEITVLLIQTENQWKMDLSASNHKRPCLKSAPVCGLGEGQVRSLFFSSSFFPPKKCKAPLRGLVKNHSDCKGLLLEKTVQSNRPGRVLTGYLKNCAGITWKVVCGIEKKKQKAKTRLPSLRVSRINSCSPTRVALFSLIWTSLSKDRHHTLRYVAFPE